LIETALGSIDAGELGITSMNEHLLSDSATLLRPAREPRPADERVTMENLGFVRWNYLALRDNLVLDDENVAASELAFARGLGQGAIVETTSWGMGPRHANLPTISRASGMHVVVAYGAYLSRSWPQWLKDMTEQQLEDHLHEALTEAIPGTDYRAGMLGLIGTGPVIDEIEHRSLVASARAAARAGASIGIRLDPAVRLGQEVLEIVTDAGLPATSIVFNNVDEFMDSHYLADLGDSGATLEMDFGNEAYYHDDYKDATDADRVAFLLRLLERSPDSSIVFGCSVWTKAQQRAFGGMGYGHMLGRIVPMLERAGVSRERLDEILVRRPLTLLDRPSTGVKP
jgi:phosphotriesterase-related protein